MSRAPLFLFAWMAACWSPESAPTGPSEPPTDEFAKPGPGAAEPVQERVAPSLAADPTILAAYHGLDHLPPRVLRICRIKAVRDDGMPVTFSVQLDAASVVPGHFEVEVADGSVVTPSCATLRPADEPLENRTVLLAGEFGTLEAPPRAVRVVGALKDVSGRSLKGLQTSSIVGLQEGPSLELAERLAPDTPGLVGECPDATKQVVQLTFQGGVTGPDGSELGEPQRTAVAVTLTDDSTVVPIALADDDPDNYVHACLDTDTPAASVMVKAGYFHDPADDPNPETRIEVVPGPF